MMDLTQDRWNAAPDFAAYLPTVQKYPELWAAMHRTSRVPEEMVSRALAIPGRWRLVALVEDWCGDAVNVVPILARLVEEVPSFELRLLGRDANPDLMNAHLTGTARAIPVVIVYDESLTEVGWWGPRPTELQDWFDREGRAMEKDARYKEIRRWHARDRGRTTLDEILRIAENAARTSAARAALSR